VALAKKNSRSTMGVLRLVLGRFLMVDFEELGESVRPRFSFLLPSSGCLHQVLLSWRGLIVPQILFVIG
jgi:hypothetical protein